MGAVDPARECSVDEAARRRQTSASPVFAPCWLDVQHVWRACRVRMRVRLRLRARARTEGETLSPNPKRVREIERPGMGIGAM